MRLNLYLRGIDVIDLEIHADRANLSLFRPRPDDDTPAPAITANSGGQFEHAGPQDEPDTAVMGFSNQRRTQ